MQYQTDVFTSHKAYQLGGLILFATAGVLIAALAFEYIGGYKPCPLCLQQRYAYYAALPLTFLSLVLVSGEHLRSAGFLLFAVALGFLANAGLGVYHTGIEWGFWPGPETCAGPLTPPTSTDSLLKELETETGVRCDEVQWSFAGLSFAGWNVVVSFVLFVLALKAALSAGDNGAVVTD
jgi:disulfide bond formation protein DsbB